MPSAVDFDIVLASVDNAESPFGIAFGDFNMAAVPGGDLQIFEELHKTRKKIEESILRRTDRITPAELKGYGRSLASALLSGDLLSVYLKCAAQFNIRLNLCATSTRLKQLPWEYVVWPDLNTGPHKLRSVARIVPTAASAPPPPFDAGRGLNVLVIAAEPTDMAHLDWAETRKHIELIFNGPLRHENVETRVTLDVIEGASRKNISSALRTKSYQVVHFVGHGQADGIALLDTRTKTSDIFPTSAFCAAVSGVDVRLVILSACDTAAVSDLSELSTIAEALVEAGIPAVVANQMPITQNIIGLFCAALYRSLLTTGSIDQATTEGRIAVAQALASTSDAAVEWGVPVLYRRSRCSQLFEVGQ